jgi:hypothetical protein
MSAEAIGEDQASWRIVGSQSQQSQKFPFACSPNAGGFFHWDPFVRKYLLVMGAGLPMQTT